MMSSANLSECLDVICNARNAAHKLVIIVGLSGSGKSKLLSEVAAAIDAAILNISLEMSRMLISMTKRQRTLKAEDTAKDAIDEISKLTVCLDNTELLFDATIELNPLRFLQDISRNRLIIATWNGIIDGRELIYGNIGHPDYFRQVVQGIPVIAVEDGTIRIVNL